MTRKIDPLTIFTPSGRPEMKVSVAQGSDRTFRLAFGLEGLLKTPSFAILRSAASRAPVILIYHCKCRSNIICRSSSLTLSHDRHFLCSHQKLRMSSSSCGSIVSIIQLPSHQLARRVRSFTSLLENSSSKGWGIGTGIILILLVSNVGLCSIPPHATCPV
ncbi:hypothetical protein EI94DRAFT_1723551 [Lactarius quietus]|nr:hypothetical protein EI94DRAFT_1723551 [Lactarius quietus]